MTEYPVFPQQSLFDVAIEVYGDVDGVFWLLADNPGLGLTDRLQVGQMLRIREPFINPRQAAFLFDFSPFQTIDDIDFPEGIDYWRIEEYLIQ